jgi:hypothetical protein
VAVSVPVPAESLGGTSEDAFNVAWNEIVAACAAIERNAITTAAQIIRGRRFTILNSFLLVGYFPRIACSENDVSANFQGKFL